MRNPAHNLFEALRYLTLFTWDFGSLVFRILKFMSGVEHRKAQREADAEKKLVLCTANPKPASTDFSAYEPMTIFTHRVCDAQRIPLGTMKFWYCSTEGIYYRDFTFLDVKVSRRLGLRNVPLKPVKLTKGDAQAALREDSLREIETILAARINQPQKVASYVEQVVSRKETNHSPSFGGENSHEGAKPHAVSDAEIKPVAPVHQPRAPERTQQSSSNVRSTGARVLSQYEGVFLAAGIGKRSIKNSSLKGPEYIDVDQFYVDIRLIASEARGAVHRVWGADLERALQASGAQADDLICVLHKGRTAVVNTDGGSNGFKNLYEVARIGGKRK